MVVTGNFFFLVLRLCQFLYDKFNDCSEVSPNSLLNLDVVWSGLLCITWFFKRIAIWHTVVEMLSLNQ